MSVPAFRSPATDVAHLAPVGGALHREGPPGSQPLFMRGDICKPGAERLIRGWSTEIEDWLGVVIEGWGFVREVAPQ
jgi:hypothetical protein